MTFPRAMTFPLVMIAASPLPAVSALDPHRRERTR